MCAASPVVQRNHRNEPQLLAEDVIPDIGAFVMMVFIESERSFQDDIETIARVVQLKQRLPLFQLEDSPLLEKVPDPVIGECTECRTLA